MIYDKKLGGFISIVSEKKERICQIGELKCCFEFDTLIDIGPAYGTWNQGNKIVKPEEKARQNIDQLFENAGWKVYEELVGA